MTDAGFQPRVTTRSVSSGWQATVQRSDGTAVSAWGATEDRAVENLESEVLG